MLTKQKHLVVGTTLFLICLLLISSLISCAPAAPPTPTKAPPPPEATPTPTLPSPTPTLAPSTTTEVIEVDFPSNYWGEAHHKPILEPMKAEFEAENPGIKIVGSTVPFAEYHDKIYAELMAGNPPDIVVPYDPQIRQYIEADLLEPLNPWLEEAGYNLDSFYPIARMAEKDGQIYAIVYGINPRVLMYNKVMFEKAGLNVPTNVEDFMKAIRTLRDPQKGQFGFATMAASGAASSTYLEIMPIIVGFGGSFVKDGRANATAPETIAALQFIKDLYDEQLIPIGQDFLVYRDMLCAGKVASLTIGGFIYGTCEAKNPEVASQLSAAPLPFPGGGTISVNTFWAIPRDAKDKDAAARFLMKLLEDKWQRLVPEHTIAIPARPGMVSDTFLRENPWFQALVDVADKAVSYAPGGAEQYAPEIMEIVVKHYQSMLFQNLPAEEAAKNMQTELEKYLASKQ